ncbi:ribonuclease [Bathymodiolus thermophilus thioautotrophic gill symbiont]|uniref:Ribonuclease G n=2 Tax=Bathymodiolus thermophilus thioautotrophic gill symbiont TaxID=2360 RepID=A0A293PB92_9GAMM|nr:ribonuclease [Bathymodiolus thermophilus thioautotrophic gill symbiont]
MIMNHILINATHSEEVRVAIVKNKKLTSLNIETSLNQKNKGNIYKGRISRVEQSLEAAFVDYGKDKQGFLPFKEVAETLKENAKASGDKLTISDVLKEGQEIIVQVEKEERGNKGAALSTYTNLAGAYMILTPNNAKSNGISRQITSTDRQSLKEIIGKIVMPENSGLIIRTAGSGKNLEELQWEVDYLSELWKSINAAAENRKAPFLIYQESDIVIRTLRDYLREDTDSVIIDDLATFQNAKEFVSFVLPHYIDRIKHFDSSGHSLFNHMDVESQVKSVFEREVSLRTGATIVFDPTEALTAIDINSARATKGADIEETAYNTNLEAAKEIAAQLQLRDIGGLVVIDFIDMTSEEHRKAIEKAMEKATSSDRARIQIGTISRFGLLEMSRQRLMSSVAESVERTCPACDGRGTVPTVPNLALSILRQLEDGCNTSNQTQKITIQSSVDVITYLLNEKRNNIGQLEVKHEVKITLLPNPYMQFPNFSISKQAGSKKSHHKSYQGISKPQYNLAENGLEDNAEIAAINSNHPTTRKPNQKKVKPSFSFMGMIKSTLGLGDKEQDKKSNKKQPNKNQNRNRNKNQNRNRNRNQNQNKAQNNKPQNKQQGKQSNRAQSNKPQNKQQNNKPQQKEKENPKNVVPKDKEIKAQVQPKEQAPKATAENKKPQQQQKPKENLQEKPKNVTPKEKEVKPQAQPKEQVPKVTQENKKPQQQQEPKENPQEKPKSVTPKDKETKPQAQPKEQAPKATAENEKPAKALPKNKKPVEVKSEEKPKVQTGNTAKPETSPNDGNKSQDGDV